MQELGITQELVLLLLNEGREPKPMFDHEVPASILAAGLLELVQSGHLALPKPAKKNFWNNSSRLELVGDLTQEPLHLQELARLIRETKNRTMQDLVYKVFSEFTDKSIRAYLGALYTTLQQNGAAVREEAASLLGLSKPQWKVDRQAVDQIIQNLRANLLEEGTPERESVILAILLDKVKLLKNYFSAYESKQIKARVNAFKEDPANAVLKEVIDILEGLYVVIIASAVAVS